MNLPWNSRTSIFGALGTAVLGSVCCTVPLVLVSLGIGGAWMSSLTALAPLRPLFIALSVGLLGFAIGRHVSNGEQSGAECDTGARPRRDTVMLGFAVVASLFLIASPWMVSGTQNSSRALAGIWPGNTERVSLAVDGMTCPSCSATVITALNRVDGVLDASVTYNPPRATVTFDQSAVSVETLIATISNTGYIARRASQTPEMKQTPEPMQTVQLDELRDTFNSNSDDVRVLAILSPTCSECIEGHNVMRQMFERFEGSQLSGSIVWIPMRPGDDPGQAARQAATFNDERLSIQGWDPERRIGSAFEKTLGLSRTAWDVYLVYEPGITWQEELPPEPSFWMHQLTADSGADQQFCLNPATLAYEIEKRLEEPS